MQQKRKKPVSDMEIGRRLADYPPELLHHLGLITLEECHRLLRLECHVDTWHRYRRVVAYS